MTIEIDQTENEIRIRPHYRFDLSLQRAFRDAYRRTDGDAFAYVVDLQAVEYIDSAALGMLLLLLEHARGKVTLKRACGNVRRILEIAGFRKIFTMAD